MLNTLALHFVCLGVLLCSRLHLAVAHFVYYTGEASTQEKHRPVASEDFLGLRNRVRWRDGGRGVNARAFCTSCATSAASIFTVSASCLTRSSLGNVRPPARRVVATMEESIETVERVSRRICDASKRNAVPPPPSQSRTVTLRREPNHLHFRPLEIRRRLLRPARGRGGQRGLHANLRGREGVKLLDFFPPARCGAQRAECREPRFQVGRETRLGRQFTPLTNGMNGTSTSAPPTWPREDSS